jgi:hypothetical protein
MEELVRRNEEEDSYNCKLSRRERESQRERDNTR